MSTLDNLIEEARANGVRDFDDLPDMIQQKMMGIAIRSGMFDDGDVLAGVDIKGLVARIVEAPTLPASEYAGTALARRIRLAYEQAATKYINEELNNGLGDGIVEQMGGDLDEAILGIARVFNKFGVRHE